jgi:hypothetical protein
MNSIEKVEYYAECYTEDCKEEIAKLETGYYGQPSLAKAIQLRQNMITFWEVLLFKKDNSIIKEVEAFFESPNSRCSLYSDERFLSIYKKVMERKIDD